MLGRRRSHDDAKPVGAANDAEAAAYRCVPIELVEPRQQARIVGQVVRMRSRPTANLPALAISIDDGTGRATAVWSGRRSIGGISLGRWVAIEGSPISVGQRVEFLNPAYTLLPHA